MLAITGITGRVGSIVARTLLSAKEPVRAVVRDAGKGAPWLERGCELALAEMNDAAALAAAFEGAEGVFVLPPPIFDPEPGFPEARATANAVRSALEATHPSKVVCISTIGAQATRPNLLTQLRLMEQALGGLGIPITFLRPAWFMENAAWDVASARNTGVISSFLQPLDKPFPMVASADVGRTAAPGDMDRPPNLRIGRATPREPERYCGRILQNSWPSSPHRSCPSRILGGSIQVAGHEEPGTTRPDARWLQ